jgi:RNA recognition motif-containing protein
MDLHDCIVDTRSETMDLYNRLSIIILEIEAASRISRAYPTQPPPGKTSGALDALTNITTQATASPPDQSTERTCGIFIGNLSNHTTSEDVEKLLHQYGKTTVKNRSGPGPHPPYTFVQLKYPRDAEDAVSTWNGYVLNGRRLRVEKEIRGHKRTKRRTRNPPPTGQLIEFGDDLAIKHSPPMPLDIHDPVHLENPGTFKGGDLAYGQTMEGLATQHVTTLRTWQI